MTRTIVLDTETTGLNPNQGDRIVSIALIELVDRKLTGRYLYRFVNPERPSSPGALKVHGLTAEFLSTQPLFIDIAREVHDFIGSDLIVAHNAQFDRGFLNQEMSWVAGTSDIHGHYPQSQWLCTKQAAQKAFGHRAGNRLDDLVDRFKVRDLRGEFKVHGALIDALLLTAVLGPLFGQASMVDFGSDLVRDMLNEGLGTPKSGGTPQASETQSSIPLEAGESCGRAGHGLGGDAVVHHAPEGGVTGPVGTETGAADADRQIGGLT